MRISRKFFLLIIAVLLIVIFLVVVQFGFLSNIDTIFIEKIDNIQGMSDDAKIDLSQAWEEQIKVLKLNAISLLTSFAIALIMVYFFYLTWYLNPIRKFSEHLSKGIKTDTLHPTNVVGGEDVNKVLEHYNTQVNYVNNVMKHDKRLIIQIEKELIKVNNLYQNTLSKKKKLEEKEIEYIIEWRKSKLELDFANKEIHKLKTDNDNLLISTKNKSKFLTNMSHEIRTPLNAIVGLSQLLLIETEGKNLSEGFLNQINTIKIAGTNLAELVDNLLDLSKIEAGKATINYQKINFSQLFVAIHQINKSRAQDKQLIFNYSIDSNVPKYIYTDRTKVNQVLMNFVGNAIKFTPRDKAILMKASMHKDKLQLAVIDEGIGIPKEAQEKIFLAFEQSNISITSNYGGTGLGLSIAKAIADQLDGRVWVESIEGQGSSFYFECPINEFSEQDNAIYDDEDLVLPKYLNDQKILIIEDDEANRQMLISFLKKLELPYDVATNGEDGLEKMLLLLPSLVICDIKIPVLSGDELIKKVKINEKIKHIPVIALSAITDESVIQDILACGFDDFLIKPLQLASLIKYFNKHLTKEKSELTELSPKLQQQLKALVQLNSFKFQEILEKISIIDVEDHRDENIKNILLKTEKAAKEKDMLSIVHGFRALDKILYHFSD